MPLAASSTAARTMGCRVAEYEPEDPPPTALRLAMLAGAGWALAAIGWAYALHLHFGGVPWTP